MRDGAIHYKLYLLKLTMAVDNVVFMILKEHFNVHSNLLCMCFCTIPSHAHTSLSTALVLYACMVNVDQYTLLSPVR